ncbi:MAG: hypothetical protein IJ002_09160 [Clostridia bacterium]|nr:hypothetical protein [Clostridia bacterium]
MKCGYNNDDRDKYKVSLRTTSAELNITLSALRNSLRCLAKYGLISSDVDGKIIVKKHIPKQHIISRAKTEKQAEDRRQKSINENISKNIRQKERNSEIERIKLYRQGLTPFIVYYQSLQARCSQGDRYAERLLQKHKDTYANEIAWIKNIHEKAKTNDIEALRVLGYNTKTK